MLENTTYLPRHLEPMLFEISKHFKAVLVVGARQVGKSTLLSHVFPKIRSIVLDPLQDLYSARADPDLFLDQFPPPLVLDEIQYATELLPAIKRRVDRLGKNGQYFLTGSQNPTMIRAVAESLAGRVGILELRGMTPLEKIGRGNETSWLESYLENPRSMTNTLSGRLDSLGSLSTLTWRGNLPGLLPLPDSAVPGYLGSYVQTYLERDIRVMGDIRDLSLFARFLGLNAALTAQEINDAQLGRELGVSPPTARRWRELLVHSFQWREIAPYHGNTIKRLSGKAKGYLSDTGLACYLQRISSPEALPVNPLFGPLFETWVVNDILTQAQRLRVPPQAYHWRTAGGAEVDLVLERDGLLYPIEIKCKSTPTGHDARGLRAFRETYGARKVKPGLIIHAGDAAFRLDPDTVAIPWNASRF